MIVRPVYDNNGRVVGTISISDGVVTLEKTLSRAKHMLRIPSGWATDATHMELLSSISLEVGLNPADARVAIDDERKVRWLATVHDFMTNGFAMDRGFGKQRFLPEKFWKQSDRNQPRLF